MGWFELDLLAFRSTTYVLLARLNGGLKRKTSRGGMDGSLEGTDDAFPLIVTHHNGH